MRRDTWLRFALLAGLPLGCPQLLNDDLIIVDGDSRADAGDGTGAASQPNQAGERGDAGASSSGGAGTGASAGGASSAGASAAGATDTTGVAGAETDSCGSPSVPAHPAGCPAVCTRCEAGFCVIECHGQDACKDAERSCPSGLACRLECEGKSACNKANLVCPNAFDCTLSCAGDDACKDARVSCTGNCAIDCTAGAKACEHLDIGCGKGKCQATCQADSIAPMMSCGTACACQPCP